MCRYTGIEPRGCVAERLANVLAPPEIGRGAICGDLECNLPYARRFAELPPGTTLRFPPDDVRIGAAALVSQAWPDEMKDLMDQDQAKQPWPIKQIGVQDDVPVADETGGMNLRAAVQRT